MKKYILPFAFLVAACTSEPDGIEDLRTEEERNQQSTEISDGTTDPVTEPQENTEETHVSTNSDYSYKVVEGENGWGYQIFSGSTMQINQMHVPSVPGVKGFETQEKAETTAQYILNEVEKGNFPPTVSPEVLDSLGVL